MKRPHFHPSRCKQCGASCEDVNGISQTGLCPTCGQIRLVENLIGMETKRGPYAKWWAYRMAVSVGYAPLDQAPDRP